MMSYTLKPVNGASLVLGCIPLLLWVAGAAAKPEVADGAPLENARWVETSASSVELGKATFGLCMSCHGEDAAGRVGIGPRIASKTYLAAASDDFLARTIRDGRGGTTMGEHLTMDH